jgi:hypothetical protein
LTAGGSDHGYFGRCDVDEPHRDQSDTEMRPKERVMDDLPHREIELAGVTERLAEVEAKCVAHGIVLQAIAALLPPDTIRELKSAAVSVDDEGMQEANPDPQLRRIAAQIRHLLQLL